MNRKLGVINDSAAFISIICLLSPHNKHVIRELDTAARPFVALG